MGYYRLHVALREDDPQDKVVIAALERLGDRGKSRWVRQVLFDAVTGPARDEILAEIRAVRDAVERLEAKGIAVAQDSQQTEGDEPPEAAHNVDTMIDRLEAWQ
jgi:hypothetical protein